MKRLGPSLAAAALAVLFTAGAPSCARWKEAAPAGRVLPPPSPSAGVPAATPADRAYAEGAAALLDGNAEAALERFIQAWEKSPGHAGVAQDFGDAVTALKKSGDEAYRAGRFEEAGKRWSAAIRYTAHPAAKARSLPFGPAKLKERVDRMTAMLMEQAIIEYRRGNIEGAIAHWKVVLAYDPSNKEAARSLKTAATQLENLKKIKPPAH